MDVASTRTVRVGQGEVDSCSDISIGVVNLPGNTDTLDSNVINIDNILFRDTGEGRENNKVVESSAALDIHIMSNGTYGNLKVTNFGVSVK